MKNRGLGKGLSALIAEQKIDRSYDNENEIINIKLHDIEESRFQPRKIFNEEAIVELAESITRHGIIQPIIVSKILHTSKYEIIAGERRWRAAKIAGLGEIPAIVRHITAQSIAEQALIENIQRENLNPLEEAEAYLELMGTHKYSQEELAQSVGKKRSHVANMIRLTSLPEIVKSYVLSEQLSFGHAKVIASCEDVEEIATEIVQRGMNVRQTENLVKNWKKPASHKASQRIKTSSEEGDDFSSIATSLTEKLGLKVDIDSSGSKGKIIIHYNNYEQLDNLVEKLYSGK